MSQLPNIPKYYSLFELATSLQSVIEKTYKRAYWVKAEIAKLNYYPKSGHCYPDLVDKKEGKVLAQMRAIIWAGTYTDITRKFKDATKEEMKEGMTILFLVKVSFHPNHGLSLNILDIEPSFTLGEMAREKTATIERLKKEGIFDRNKKLDIPLLPKNLAIISVETSKGYHDFINIINGNNWGYYFHTTLFPALLQGDSAVKSLTGQLNAVKAVSERFDVVLIIRGGGGDVGLNCYDNYLLAKEVATFPLPVLTGIGHSTNETVTEMVANQNLITPTDVAYFLIGKFHNFSVRVQDAEKKISAYSNEILTFENQKLSEVTRLFRSLTQNLLMQNKHILNEFETELQNKSGIFIANRKRYLNNIRLQLKYKPSDVLKDGYGKLTVLSTLLNIRSKQILKNHNNGIERIAEKVRLLEPTNILKRGYSITTHNGKPVKDVRELKKGETIKTEIYNGSMESKIEKTNYYGK